MGSVSMHATRRRLRDNIHAPFNRSASEYRGTRRSPMNVTASQQRRNSPRRRQEGLEH